MHWFILAVLALAAAAALWYFQAVNRELPVQPPVGGEEAFRHWLDAPGVPEGLEQAVDALVDLMAHPELGGPGFLTVRLPQPGEGGFVTVTAQYPNIREALYRHVVRQELGREALLEAGMAETLLTLAPAFESDSGGVVIVTLQAAAMESELVGRLSGRGERQEALNLLAGRLARRFPALEVRTFGAELLLTPVRETAAV